MRFKIPGRDVSVRLFHRVETKDSQYDIFDVGLEQADGAIDSIVVGGSFAYAKSLARKADKQAEKAKAKKAKKAKKVEAIKDVADITDGPVVNTTAEAVPVAA